MKPLLLVVDDDPEILQLLEVTLRWKGFRVTTASTGFEAWQLAQEKRPDLILSDNLLPGLDGMQLLELVRNDPELHETPFMIFSAYYDTERVVHGLENGLDDYVPKPIRADEMVARIRKALRSNPHARGCNLSGDLGDIQLADLLQMLSTGRQTGKLILEDDKLKLTFTFHFGEVLTVEATDGRGGKQAFFAALELEKGSFRFYNCEVSRSGRQPMHIQFLLMEGMRLMDERLENEARESRKAATGAA